MMKIFCKFVNLTVFLLFISFAVSSPVSAQESLLSVDFVGFAGDGFAPVPEVGQLDSDVWIVTGFNSGVLDFGDTQTSGDFARGESDGGVSTGGIYAFDVGGGNIALGVQPGGSDFTPGEIILKIQNNTGETVTQLDVSYDIWYYNDEVRANTLNFSYSSDNSAYTEVSELNFTTPGEADTTPVWRQPPESELKPAILTGLSIANGDLFYLKWTGKDATGSGSRDEYGIDNIEVAVSDSDVAPYVFSTTPADGTANVITNANIDIRFSEPVSVSGNWFQIVCGTSGTRNVSDTSVTGGPKNWTIDPSTDFSNGETCTITIDKDQINDDADDPSDYMTDDHDWSFGTVNTIATHIVINEVDCDTDGDTSEFIELYDGGAGNTALDGLVLVFYNGHDDKTYRLTPFDAIDLDGYKTDAGGYLLIANRDVAADIDIEFEDEWLQNGSDAVVLYVGDEADFPVDTPVTTANLLDAFVYGTNDPDDTGLLVLLNTGEPQVNEAGEGDSVNHSNQRCPNGSGGQRNTSTYTQAAPTPKVANCSGCGGPATFIHDIQGAGPASPEDGNTHTIEGVVVGDFQEANQFSGFFVQEEDADADDDPATSEGIFVYYNSVNVNVGDVVRVTGEVDEYNDLTELKNVSEVIICTSVAALPSPAVVNLPFADLADLERYEGMRIQLSQTLTITDNRDLGRYGQIVLSSGRLMNPTAVTAPGASANAQQAANELNRIIIDDGSSIEYPDPIPYPGSGLSASNTLRAGDTVSGLTGVLLHYAFDKYSVHPTVNPVFVSANPRTTAPSVGGRLRIAGFNLLNYFNGDGAGGEFPTSRGADTFSEFNRQRGKIISAILAMNADVIGLTEIENDDYGTGSAIQDLINGLNDAAAAGVSYAFIDPGFDLGLDKIKAALLYRVETVTPVGSAATTNIWPHPPLAQTFEEISTNERFTVAVNHFKARVCGSASGDNADQGDGQGCWNLKRTQAAETLISWLGTDPTDSKDPDILIIGDLNAYAKEDPIAAIEAAGYANLIAEFCGTDAYSYVYFGEAGYIDHAFANDSLASQAKGATHWHINVDEPHALDYNKENKSDGQLASLYSNDPYRASDHDPVIIGLDLGAASASNYVCTDINLSGSHSIPENQPASTFIGTLSAIDPDPGDSHTFYRVVRWDGWIDNGSFMLDRNDIRIPPFFEGDTLTTAAVFDYESKNNYSIYIRCNDSNGGSCFKSFTINVSDVNESPAGLVLSYRWIDEAKPAGTTVGTFTTQSDPDIGDTHTYSLVSGEGDADNSLFTIDAGVLKSEAVFDYETQKHGYNIRVRTTDSGVLTHDGQFIITLLDRNEAPTEISLSNRSMDENRPEDTEIGTFSATDEDIAGSHAYSLVSGEGDADNSLFIIDAGILKSGAVFDYETHKHDYSIRVRTTDSGGLAYDGQFVITLRDRNEAPTEISLSNSSVDENRPADTEIGTFSATDEDIAGNHAYSLVSGKGDADNASFHISGNYLKTKSGFDYETKHDYSIRVQTDDGSGGIFQKQFSITVDDVNDAPEDVTLSSSSVPENQPDGIDIGVFSATDADSGDTHTYSLISGPGRNDNSLFSISGNTLSAVSGFDYEAKESYTIRVRTTDTRGGIYDKPFTITVENVDEPPAIADPIGDVTAYNNGEAVTIAMTGLFTDTDDADDAIKKMVESNTDPEVVEAAIDGETLTLDYHQCGTAKITLLADSDGKSVTDAFYVTVLPVSGDMNCDGIIDLKDAIMVLQLLSGIHTADIYPDADTNDDGRIGIEDLIHILMNINASFDYP
ncbi:ExeM/NucH family extracellular endonuclease [Desulfobacterales bacterium HSG2]|nr:ExeM/NucH family extracellular endonuclease [Desulfobacterales bacterium HSG2]